jgi:hypothetical protein
MNLGQSRNEPRVPRNVTGAPPDASFHQVGYPLVAIVYAWGMDEKYDLFSAIYKALDRLEELDPASPKEEWFKLLEWTAGKTLAPHIEPVEPTQQ